MFSATNFGGVRVFVETEPGNVTDSEGGRGDLGLSERGLEATGISDIAVDAGKELSLMIESVTRTVSGALDAVAPDEWSIELNVGFKGEAGIPFITKGETNASVKVLVKWKRNAS